MTHMQQFEIRPVNIEHYHDDLCLLTQDHYDEVITTDYNYTAEPDFEMLYKMNQAGILYSLGVFSNGKMIGYSINMICTPVYNKKIKIFTNLLFFIKKSGRVGRNGINLIKRTEKLGREVGAKQVSFSAGKGTNLDKILARYSYTNREIVRQKKL